MAPSILVRASLVTLLNSDQSCWWLVGSTERSRCITFVRDIWNIKRARAGTLEHSALISHCGTGRTHSAMITSLTLIPIPIVCRSTLVISLHVLLFLVLPLEVDNHLRVVLDDSAHLGRVAFEVDSLRVVLDDGAHLLDVRRLISRNFSGRLSR